MNTPETKIHPLFATAAIAIVVVSLAGTAAFMGWLPFRQPAETPAAQTPSPGTDTAGVSPAAAPATGASPAVTASPANNTAAVSRPPTSKPQSAQNSSVAAPASVPVPAQAQSPVPAQAQPVCMDCGRVVAVRAVEQASKPSGVGAVAGAVVGGVLGNQVGGGTGKTLATVAGAVGGGMAGNEIEKRTRKTTAYEVDVQMDHGIRQSFSFEQQPTWREGDKVRVSNGALVAR